MGEEDTDRDQFHTARADTNEQDFGRTINQGHRWGSPAPDKGNDRLAARCTVDSQLHFGDDTRH